jgi:sigma-70-like protein
VSSKDETVIVCCPNCSFQFEENITRSKASSPPKFLYKVLELREKGLTLKEIGIELGISESRVCQIMKYRYEKTPLLKRDAVKHRKGFSYEECYLESRKYKSLKEFSLGSPAHYSRGRNCGWLELLYPKRRVINLDTGHVYKSVRDAAAAARCSTDAIYSAIKLDRAARGFRWAYFDKAEVK